jgi:nitrogen fixation negative regulator NifL
MQNKSKNSADGDGASPSRQDAAPVLFDGLFVETVQQSPIAISITDEKANIIYVNKAFTEVTGYGREESIGRNESMLSDKRTPPEVYQELWKRLQAKQAWRGCLVNRHKDGGRYLADVSIAPILDERGETSHYIGMHRDITEVYTLEQKVKNQKVLIETVVDSIPVAAVLLDEADRTVLENRMYKALAGELQTLEPVRAFLNILREEMGEEWNRIKRSADSFRNRELRFDRGGHHTPRWYACAGTWFTHDDDSIDGFFEEKHHTYLLLTFNDITQQKKHEEEIRINALRTLMAEEEKVQSLREALLGAIHHIQGPLNLLNAAKNLLLRRGQAEQNLALLGILEQIVSAGETSIATLRSCTPESRGASVSPVNLNQLLHEVIIVLTDRLLSGGIVVDWRPTPVLPSIMGVETRLRAMFKNVIENAIDAMNHSGIVTRELRISTWPDEDLIHVCIEDTGPGVPEPLCTKIFEPFFTTKTSGSQRHSGMGLAIAQEVINQHLGIIRIDQTYKEGCRVHIQFNIHAYQSEANRPYAYG